MCHLFVLILTDKGVEYYVTYMYPIYCKLHATDPN